MNIVYIATNSENAKRYIGVTRRPLVVRQNAHRTAAFRSANEGMRFHAAIRKYGWEAFKWAVLKVYETYEEALAGEVCFIATFQPEYNVCKGGLGGPSIPVNMKPVVCLSTGKFFPSLTSAARHYGLDPPTLCQACKPSQHSTCGGMYFRYAQEIEAGADFEQMITEIKTSTAQHRRRGGKRNNLVPPIYGNRRGREVVCTTDSSSYPSASAAARAYDLPRSAIIELCLGKNFRRLVGGFHFVYR